MKLETKGGVEVKERPILFSGPMVRAILEGRKTMTRRVVKHIPALGQPEEWCHKFSCGFDPIAGNIGDWCPYGKTGARLWVRETFVPYRREHVINNIPFAYRADCTPVSESMRIELGYKWKPSIFMPRWASRITLEITGVRVERLNEISEQDAVKEGLKPVIREKAFTVVCRGGQTFEVSSLYRGGVPVVGDNSVFGEVTHIEPIPEKVILTAREAFKTLWGNINGRESWAKNPWVWVVEFVRVES